MSTRFIALSDPQFRLLFIGTTLAQVAFGMMNVVQGIVAFDLTGKNSAVGFVSLGMGTSMLFLGPVGGTLSDRLSKRKLLMFAQTVIGLMFGVTAVLIVSGAITIWLLAGSTLVMGSMFAIMGPTRQAWVGDMLDGEMRTNGVALQQLMMNATRIVGPLLAGAFVGIGFIGAGGTYFAMASVYVLVLVMLAFMRPSPPRSRSTQSSVRADLAEGVSYIWTTKELRLLAGVFAGVVLTGFSYQTVLPGFLHNELDKPTSILGVVYGVTAVGGIITTVVLAGRPGGDTARMMLSFAALLAVSLFALAVAPNFIATLGVAVVIGVSSSGFQLLNNVNLMERTAPQYYGRVMAVTMMSFGFNSIFAYPVGQLADAIGERPTLAILGGLCLGVVILGALAARSVFARRPFTPLGEPTLMP